MSLQADTTPVPSARQCPLRVLVVDDSATQRAMLVALLDGDAEIEVVGFAATGAEAIRAVTRLKPDVITMDLRLPELDGIEATRRIMQEAPTPIVVVTAHASRDDTATVSRALEAGALALVEKPAPGPCYQAQRDDLLRTLKSMARVRVVRRWSPDRLRPSAPRVEPTNRPRVVVIGASTGGPQALHTILPALPATFSLPILIVQHMAAGFTSRMVEWLRPACALPIQLASTGTPVQSRGIYVAPAGSHLAVRQRTMTLTDDAPIRGHRPSATLLFQSVADEYGAAAIGVLLTGMGDDGAAGMQELKNAGAVTIAQNEATSVIFGMPKAAIHLGAVDYVLPHDQIGPLLVELAGHTSGV